MEPRGNRSPSAEALPRGRAGRKWVDPQQCHALCFHQQDEEDEAEEVSELPKNSKTPKEGECINVHTNKDVLGRSVI